jgi:hypothetical protein
VTTKGEPDAALTEAAPATAERQRNPHDEGETIRAAEEARTRAQQASEAEEHRTQELNDSIMRRAAEIEAENQRRKEQYEAEMAAHRAQVEAAEAAKRAYEAELARVNAAREQYARDQAAYEAQINSRRTKNEKDALANWPEAVTVCELDAQNPQSKFGNWKCIGPLQFDYAKLGASGSEVTVNVLFNISNTCGGKPESVRDLGMVNGYHIFGCSFGMHPDPAQRTSIDVASKYGISYIPGRDIYRCPKLQSFCRVH